MPEAVNHPAHYGGDTPYETIKVLEAWMGRGDVIAFCHANAIKYLSRSGKKGFAEEDLKKARWYINYELRLRQSPAMQEYDAVKEACDQLDSVPSGDKDLLGARLKLQSFFEPQKRTINRGTHD